MTRYSVATLCQRPIFIEVLQAISRADDFALVYVPEVAMNFATFFKTIGGFPWALKVPIGEPEITRDGMVGLAEYGNRMIADVEAHYRQQLVSR